MDNETRIKTDYLIETLRTEQHTQIEIFEQMLATLEDCGKCRSVYHRLAFVLFGKYLSEADDD